MKQEKIVHMRVHQAVNFEKTLESYFAADPGPGRKAANMTFMPEIQCVLVEGKIDKIIIPFVNIAFLKLETEAYKKIQEEKKEEVEKSKKGKRASIPKPR